MNTNTIAMLLTMGFAARGLDELGLEENADAIRDMMDPLWFSLTEEERQIIRKSRRFNASDVVSLATSSSDSGRVESQDLAAVLGAMLGAAYVGASRHRVSLEDVAQGGANDNVEGIAA